MASRDRLSGIADGAAASWLTSLPVIGAGMVCFWLQRDAEGAAGPALAVGAIVLVVGALLVPGIVCALRAGRTSPGVLMRAVLKALLVAVVALVLASLLSAVSPLRPEEVSFFSAEFALAHALAAAVPTLLAAGWILIAAWRSGAGRFVPALVMVAAGIAGVFLWRWSAEVGYGAMRFSNADAILLVAQTVALAALLLACIGSAALCHPRSSAT